MATFRQPANKRQHTTVYGSFRGVDFSGDPTKIDNSRSPHAPNLISDSGGYPERRVGWRSLKRVEAPVNGLFHVVIDGASHWLVHGGAKLYRFDPATEEVPQLLREGITSAPSFGFHSGGKFYLLTGGDYLQYDGSTVRPVREVAKVPLVSISRLPSGGGVVYESVNLLSPFRTDSFLCDGQSTVFQPSAADIEAVTGILYNGEAYTGDYEVNRVLGRVTFPSAPAAPEVSGQDNLEITFEKQVPGYAERIEHCRFGASFGVGGADYWFLSGNPDHPATDWCSALRDPTYFPDLGYAQVGSESSAVVGYLRVGEDLAILKEDNAQDATIFLRSALEGEDGAVFPIRQGVSGVGALSHRSLGRVQDEPLFLSRQGVFSIVSSAITAQRSLRNRSYFIDPVLCREEGLSQAVAVSWEGRYLLAVNDRCYVLDGSQRKAYRSGSADDYVYECWHWQNIPARCFLPVGEDLYFGTADGRICRFNNDQEGVLKYHDDGEPIPCEWSTKADDDGDFLRQKRLLPRGVAIQIKPYTRGSVSVLVRSEYENEREVFSGVTDLFSFDEVDFARFVFNATDRPQVLTVPALCRNYLTMQFVVRSTGLREGFGVLGIIKRFTMGRSRR